jgi:DNA (cytosine-5)-methyltransferase 1
MAMDSRFQERLKFEQVEKTRLTWYEFFAGGGMARLGMGEDWDCLFSNEWCPKKASTYRRRHGAKELRVCDVADLTPEDLPGVPTLVWASFPCQDLSLAGNGAGLEGNRSGTFRPFWELVCGMVRQRRQPQLIVLENVVGMLTSHDGWDFTQIVDALATEGYRLGALVLDAVRFLPQSRPRLFFVGVHRDTAIPLDLMTPRPSEPWHTKSLRSAVARLPEHLQDAWVWWSIPVPWAPVQSFAGLIEEEPTGVDWHTKAETDHIVDLMSPLHREKLRKAQLLGKRVVGTVYRRTRPNQNGINVQRAEIRFDQISGCLRTPVGGSSRQTILIVDGRSIRSRLLSPREAARLMGVPDDYPLPDRYNDAYHLFGDGLAVPVVRWLSTHLLTPIGAASRVTIAA